MKRTHSSVIFSVLLFSCLSPSLEQEVKKDFQKRNPEFTLKSVHAGEGDSDSAYMYLDFVKKGEVKVSEEIWLYQKNKEGRWEFKSVSN